MKPATWHPEDLDQIPCDFCKTYKTRNLFVRPDGMRVVECISCGLAYVNPRPKPELVPRLYDQNYFTKTAGETQVGYPTDYLAEKNRQAMISAAESKLRLLEPIWQAHGTKCLEVGCATGEFCYVLKQHGAEPVGLDLSEFVILQARRIYPELDFRTGGIESIAESNSFDAVFAFELIEHVLSPSGFLQNAQRVLRPGGLLVLSTPNLDCAKAIGCEKWLGFHVSFEHLYFLAPEALRKLADQHGFAMRYWFTGCGSGVFAPPYRARLRSVMRDALDQVGLLGTFRAIRRRCNLEPRGCGFAAEGRQHTLLAALQKARS